MRLLLATLICLLTEAMAGIQDDPLTNNEVLRVTPHTQEQVDQLRELFDLMEPVIDEWQSPSHPGRNVDFRINKWNDKDLRKALKVIGLEASVMIADVEQIVVDQEKQRKKNKAEATSGFGGIAENVKLNRMKRARGGNGGTNGKKKTTTAAPNTEAPTTAAPTTAAPTTEGPTTPAPSEWHNIYHNLSEIQTWLNEKASAYSSIASIDNIGSSFRGEAMMVMKIKTQGDDPNRPKVWIQCGIHAREWVSPASCMFMIDQILVNYNTDASLAATVDKYDWYFLTVTNPDGYKYTWTDNRLWRKTRSIHPSSTCIGADPNRNYPVDWGNHSYQLVTWVYVISNARTEKQDYPEGVLVLCSSITDKRISGNQLVTVNGSGTYCFALFVCIFANVAQGRASSNPCSSTFYGTSVQSEPEVSSTISYIGSKTNWSIYIDIHSYSQMWLSPFGYTRTKPEDNSNHMTASAIAVNALEAVHGTSYVYGTIYEIIYAASGGSGDWAYTDAGIVHSYGLELRDTGTYGFLLPSQQIIPTSQETMAGILALAEYVTP